MPRIPHSSLLGTIPHALRIERVRPVFTPLASLAELDVEKLTRRARAEIEPALRSRATVVVVTPPIIIDV